MRRNWRKRRLIRQRKKLIRLICILSVVLAVLLMVSLFITPDELKGDWRDDGGTTYRFKGRGKGFMYRDDDLGKFTYEISGGILRIDFAREDIPDRTYKFSVKDQTLTLEDQESEEILVFRKRK